MRKCGSKAGRNMKNAFLIFALFAGVTIVTNQIFERIFHFSLFDSAANLLREPGYTAGFLIVALLSADIVLPVPSSLVMIVSGALFGTTWGGSLSLLGSLLGNWVGFELMRRWKTNSSKLASEVEMMRMRPLFDRFGAFAIVISRPLPVLMETFSLAAGFFGMSRSRFIAASLLGTLPMTYLYSYAGSRALETRSIVPALLALTGIPAIMWLLVQRRLKV